MEMELTSDNLGIGSPRLPQKEIWKKVPGYPNHVISTLGNVKNTKTNHILIPTKATNGYLQVKICFNSTQISKCIHHLMAKTFLGKKPYLYEVSHKNGDKENNEINNLEYVFYKENRTKSKYPPVYCIVCGTKLSGYKRKTCSDECFKIIHWVTLNCRICGKIFKRRKSEVSAANPQRRYSGFKYYCSRECFYKDIKK